MRTGDQIVQDLPWRWGVQGKIFIIGGLGYLFDAYDIALNGFLMPLLGTHFDLTLSQRGFVATANLIGMAIGAIAWGSIADRIGRKKAFSVTLLIFALFSVLGALSPTYPVFLLLRFLAGVGLGGCIPVDYALVAEFSPKKYRGRVLTALDVWWPVGVTLCGLVSTAMLTLDHNWRWMLATMTLPALLLFWVRRGVPESPGLPDQEGQGGRRRGPSSTTWWPAPERPWCRTSSPLRWRAAERRGRGPPWSSCVTCGSSALASPPPPGCCSARSCWCITRP
ncbi:MFS transporter [Streptomyces sp. WAC 01420]|uniref:MFS transporter n=1 Tax=Streptomyces sp. WAC 01420 TaxID=2203203 RepID=UPI00268AB038|nr:MFS transporter [Streptomyces sp. WAC 01420]